MTTAFSSHLLAEHTLTVDHHQRICDLLVTAFPQYQDLFSNVSYYYAVPEYRLWIENEAGLMVAHLDFERRIIGVNGEEVTVAGVGEVATHPDYQKQGLGRMLMDKLKVVLQKTHPVDYGFLHCREAVTGFYRRVGWHRIHQPVHEQDLQTGEVVVEHGPTMILPVHRTFEDWQTEGHVDLRGLPW